MVSEKKKDVINCCLDCFIDNGLTKTTTKDLSTALNLQNGGVYYYFNTKTEIVISCAEEAINRLENRVFNLAFEKIADIGNMIKVLEELADELSPIMKFLVSVCVSKEYGDKIKPALIKLADRYLVYSEKFAKALNCKLEDVKPLVYLSILAINNYMIFSEKALFEPQIELVKTALLKLKNGEE